MYLPAAYSAQTHQNQQYASYGLPYPYCMCVCPSYSNSCMVHSYSGMHAYPNPTVPTAGNDAIETETASTSSTIELKEVAQHIADNLTSISHQASTEFLNAASSLEMHQSFLAIVEDLNDDSDGIQGKDVYRLLQGIKSGKLFVNAKQTKQRSDKLKEAYLSFLKEAAVSMNGFIQKRNNLANEPTQNFVALAEVEISKDQKQQSKAYNCKENKATIPFLNIDASSTAGESGKTTERQSAERSKQAPLISVKAIQL